MAGSNLENQTYITRSSVVKFMEFFALKFQFWISKHRDEDQEIQNDTEHAAGEVLSGGDEEVGMVVPAPAVADGDEVLKSPRILSQPPILVSWYQLRCVSQELLHCSWGRGTSRA